MGAYAAPIPPRSRDGAVPMKVTLAAAYLILDLESPPLHFVEGSARGITFPLAGGGAAMPCSIAEVDNPI